MECILIVIGAEHNPTAAVIDYEKFNKNITIARGGTNHTLLIDTIDDDVVEPPVKYFHIEIDENSLPDGVSVGMIHKIRINFTDDDGNHFLLCRLIALLSFV